MILIIDNYDSFTQNLVQYVGTLNFNVEVRRNNNVSINYIKKRQPSHIIISPGPGHPKDSYHTLKIIQKYAKSIPILGVCLGHQIIGHLYDYDVVRLSKPIHGKLSQIMHNKNNLFGSIPSPFIATRYHSLIIQNNKQLKTLEITAWTEDGLVMACQHTRYKKLKGIQFHPESLWTDYGQNIIRNFLST